LPEILDSEDEFEELSFEDNISESWTKPNRDSMYVNSIWNEHESTPAAVTAMVIGQLPGIDWENDCTVARLSNIMEKEASTLKKGDTTFFHTPIGSLFAFLPLVFWENLMYETNKYVLQKTIAPEKNVICGHL